MKNVEKTELLAAKMRKCVLEEVFSAKSGHPGGSLSSVDFLACIYENYMNVDPKNPRMPNRDRFVLSKGHCSPALYAVLALKGFFPVEDLLTFRNINSYLQGHPNMTYVPGVDMSTGSLGQGISAAVGMAIACREEKYNNKVFVVLGDGELQEGQVWEAAMCAAHYNLNNLIAFVDLNGLQIDGKTTDVMNVGNVAEKFSAFDWNVFTCNGNSVPELIETLNAIVKADMDGPYVIIGDTTKGKGISYMEGQYQWHGSCPNQEQYELAIIELDEKIQTLEARDEQ